MCLDHADDKRTVAGERLNFAQAAPQLGWERWEKKLELRRWLLSIRNRKTLFKEISFSRVTVWAAVMNARHHFYAKIIMHRAQCTRCMMYAICRYAEESCMNSACNMEVNLLECWKTWHTVRPTYSSQIDRISQHVFRPTLNSANSDPWPTGRNCSERQPTGRLEMMKQI